MTEKLQRRRDAAFILRTILKDKLDPEKTNLLFIYDERKVDNPNLYTVLMRYGTLNYAVDFHYVNNEIDYVAILTYHKKELIKIINKKEVKQMMLESRLGGNNKWMKDKE